MKNVYAFQEHANTAFRKANRLREQGRVRSAISIYNELLNGCSDVSAQGLLTWALGSLHWSDAGNGEESRRFFKENVALYEKHKELQKAEKAHLWAANSCENLMLLSLSYEEYDVWAEKLKSLQPKNDILQIQVPEVHESRDRAFPWVRVMQGIMAYPILQTGTPQSTGRVASGAAILQLILKNRKKLRVPLDVWQETVMNYTQAIVMTAEHCYTRINESGGVMDPDEFLFIVDDSIPLVEEYVRANPSNSEVQEGLAQMKKDQENFRQEKGQQVETHTLVEFQWEMNPALEEAIRDTGVQGLQFKLVKVGTLK